MKPRKPHIGLLLAVAFCFGACSSGSSTQDEDDGASSGGLPSSSKKFARKSGGACKVFHETLDFTLAVHPEKDISYKPYALAMAWTALQEDDYENESPLETQTRINKRRQFASVASNRSFVSDGMKACALVEDLFEKARSESTMTRSELLKNKMYAYRAFLYYTMQSIDGAYSSYLLPDSEAYQAVERDRKVENKERFEYSSGLQISYRTDYDERDTPPDYLHVAEVVPESPAEDYVETLRKSRIYAIRQEGNAPWSTIESYLKKNELAMSQLIERLTRGDSPQKWQLKGRRADTNEDFEIEIQMEKNAVKETYGEIIENGEQKYAYIKLLSFHKVGAIKNLLETWSLLLEKEGKLENLILDFRNNGGGWVTEIQTLLRLFLPAGPNLQVQTRIDSEKEKIGPLKTIPIYTSEKDSNFRSLQRLIVLVDRGSASAAEISAAVLSELNLALVIGESSTYGKFSGSRFRDVPPPLGGGHYFIGSYAFTPKGRSHHIESDYIHIAVDEPTRGDEIQIRSMKKALTKYHYDPTTPSLPKPAPIASSLETEPDPILRPELLEKLKASPKPTPPSCQVSGVEDPNFTEESDCILDSAKEYMKRWIELESPIAASAETPASPPAPQLDEAGL